MVSSVTNFCAGVAGNRQHLGLSILATRTLAISRGVAETCRIPSVLTDCRDVTIVSISKGPVVLGKRARFISANHPNFHVGVGELGFNPYFILVDELAQTRQVLFCLSQEICLDDHQYSDQDP